MVGKMAYIHQTAVRFRLCPSGVDRQLGSEGVRVLSPWARQPRDEVLLKIGECCTPKGRNARYPLLLYKDLSEKTDKINIGPSASGQGYLTLDQVTAVQIRPDPPWAIGQ